MPCTGPWSTPVQGNNTPAQSPEPWPSDPRITPAQGLFTPVQVFNLHLHRANNALHRSSPLALHRANDALHRSVWNTCTGQAGTCAGLFLALQFFGLLNLFFSTNSSFGLALRSLVCGLWHISHFSSILGKIHVFIFKCLPTQIN